MVTPKDILLPYQRRWVDDQSRYKIGLWSRQVGKSFSTAEEAVEDCFQRKTKWVCISAGERQSLEWMEKAKQWTEAYGMVISDYFEDRASSEALMKSAEIIYPSGARILSLPANPATVRGYTANLVLDEFSHHEKPDEIWRATFPSVTRAKMKVRIVSTANGQGNKFYKLWSADNRYSKHLITIHDAVKHGLDVDVDEIREGFGDPEYFAQEYECQFLDSSSILIPYELIAQCEHAEASIGYEWNGHKPPNPIYIGIDFARKRDNTVAWVFERIGDILWTREVVVLTGVSTPDQIDFLRKRISYAERVVIDYSGPGIGFGDYLVKEHGEYKPNGHKFGKIELCTFTNTLVREVMPKMRMAFEDRRLRIPINRDVREDLHSIHRTATPTGQLTYKAPFTKDGHSDRGYACALAIRAADCHQGVYYASAI